MSIRVNGFVLGKDQKEDKTVVWKVRVKDPSSPHNGRKFAVASIRGDLQLAQGLNVTFEIGSIDDSEGNPIPIAVDVQLQLIEP